MTRGVLVVGLGIGIAGCTTVANPRYCDENRDCVIGTSCNLATHGCVAVDASVPVDTLVSNTVQEVRSDSVPDGTPVELTDVIVIGIDESPVGFWVQQPGGGIGSAIFVFGANTDDVGALLIGDVIDVTGGRKQHFTSGGDTSGRSQLEVSPQGGTISIVRKGVTATPVVTDIDLASIGNLPPVQLQTTLERNAGTFVRVQTVQAVGDATTISGDQAVSIGPLFLRAGLAAFPPGVMNGTCFTSIAGIWDYSREYSIQPQFTTNIEIGAACL